MTDERTGCDAVSGNGDSVRSGGSGPVRGGRRPFVVAAAGAAAVLAAGWLGGSREAGLARQAATSTPIRLSRMTPTVRSLPTAAATRTPTGRPRPTATATVASRSTAVVVEIDVDEPEDAAPTGPAVEIAAADWAGAYYEGNSPYYGRPWAAVYGAFSQFPSATCSFDLSAVPDQPLVLTVDGLDDELTGKNPIALEVNGRRVYEGESPFTSWDGAGQGENAAWTTVQVALPVELFVEGENRVSFLNLSQSDAEFLPPYFLLSTGSIGVLVEG